jgi:hypothetical protein
LTPRELNLSHDIAAPDEAVEPSLLRKSSAIGQSSKEASTAAIERAERVPADWERGMM